MYHIKCKKYHQALINTEDNDKKKPTLQERRFSNLICFLGFYPPKSSKRTFSGGTPKSSHILTTA